jgi:putative flippase GtrA
LVETSTNILKPILERRGVRQFVKFCIIGFSSMILDVGIAKFLTYGVHWHWIAAQILSFAVAVTNGFTWNSLWTFKGLNSSRKRVQYVKFVIVNIIGLALNLGIMKGMFLILTGQVIMPANPSETHWNIAKAAAIVIVAFWNFFANKYWTFSEDRAPARPLA